MVKVIPSTRPRSTKSRGEIAIFDRFISDNGYYRLLISPNADQKAWPEMLSVGTGANAFVLLRNITNIMKHEKELTNYTIENLNKINSLKIIGNPKNKAGVISFTIKGIHPHDISTIVDEDGVAIRAGHHCCQILHERLNLTATARVSIGIYNTKEDIDILCKAIENCRKVFKLK